MQSSLTSLGNAIVVAAEKCLREIHDDDELDRDGEGSVEKSEGPGGSTADASRLLMLLAWRHVSCSKRSREGAYGVSERLVQGREAMKQGRSRRVKSQTFRSRAGDSYT